METKRVYQQDPGLDLEIQGPDPEENKDHKEPISTTIKGKRVYLEDAKK